ncbi:MAG: 23S rRNA (uracil(1939)-C(5))-methyltransferase RlmD [Bacilli bacterium]|nr:23S rRNA (uracil(1939)-C(5))-methyltransferase RlmD [Bacilli bacterium]
MNDVIKCPYGKDCGGCNLLGKRYSDTLDIKINYVNDLFKEARIDYKIKECVPSPNQIAYRNKMIIGFKNLKGNIIAGFYEEGSHHIVNIDNCLMHTDAQNKIFKDFLYIIKKLHLEIYDEDKRFGLIRYLLIGEAFTTGEIMVVIVTSTNIFPARANLVKELRRLNPNITTIIQNINPRKTSIVLGEEQRTLFGPGFIYDYIGDIKFRLGPKSFFQVNPAQAYNLYNEVKRLADLKACETVVDAYSGVSTISAFIAKDAKKVISIENNKEACLAGIANLKDNNIKNVFVENEDATNYLVNEAKLHHTYDVVVLDPPRSGSTPEFINAVASVGAKKVIYVSCDPNTLVRDLKLFINKGYKIREAKCFDMFCFSNHIETIVKLDLKEI